MASKCRNIWDTLRCDVATTCSPTLSYYPVAVGAGLSSCPIEMQHLKSNSSRRKCNVKGEKIDEKCHRDPKTAELSRRSLNTNRSHSAVLESSACLLRQNRESSSVNLTASNSAKTVASSSLPRSTSANYSKTSLCASRDVTRGKGSDNRVPVSTSSVHCRDTSVAAVSSLTGFVAERPSANRKRAVEFPGETNLLSDPLSLLKVSSANSGTIQEKRKRSDACGATAVHKTKHGGIESRGRATESSSNNCTSDFGSVDAKRGHGVGKVLGAPSSSLDRLPVAGVVLSTSQNKRCSSQTTKTKQTTIRNDHNTNSAAVKTPRTDVSQRRQIVTAPLLGSGYSSNNFNCQSPDADVEAESLSDAGEIPMFSSPFETTSVNYNPSTDSGLSVYCGSTLARPSHPEGGVRSDVCDLVSSVNYSNVSLSHISRTSISGVSESGFSSGCATNGVIRVKELGRAEAKAIPKGANVSANASGSGSVCNDAIVDTYVVMLGGNAYRKLQCFYTSSKNSNELPFRNGKSDSEASPDCCDEGFVGSPMTTDDAMESVNDVNADQNAPMPTKVSDSEVYELTRMLVIDENDRELTCDGIQNGVDGTFGSLEADTLRKANALRGTNLVQETKAKPKSNRELLLERFASELQCRDYSKDDCKSLERKPMSKSKNTVDVNANNDLIELDQFSHGAAGGNVTNSKDSLVSDVSFISRSDRKLLFEQFASELQCCDYSKDDCKSLERKPMSKSENTVDVNANNDWMQLDQSSHSATAGNLRSNQDSLISDACFISKSDRKLILKRYTNDLYDSKGDCESVERKPVSKSKNTVDVNANNDLMGLDQSSHSAAGGNVTNCKDSLVSGANFSYGNSVRGHGNDAFSKGYGIRESVGANSEVGDASLDSCQTHLSSTTETAVSQCNAETSSPSFDIKTKRFKKTKPMSISSTLLPELNTDAYSGGSKLSENALSPCTSISESIKCFPRTSTHLPQDVCPSKNFDDSNVARKRCDPFETQKVDDILSSDFKTNCALECDGGHSGSESSWGGDRAYDTFSETSRSRSDVGPADCRTENLDDFASKSRKRTSKQPRMLNEIANTVGFMVDKRQSHQQSHNLFADSKLLTREERVLQMVHMQITKMEVKEEMTKLKKTKSISETIDQDNKNERGKQVSSGHHFTMIPHHHVQRRIKASGAGRTSKHHQLLSQHRTLHRKRIRKNVWSSRTIRFGELRDTAMFKKMANQSWCDRKKFTASSKKPGAENGFGGQFHVRSYLDDAGSRGHHGGWRSTIGDEYASAKYSSGRADAELLTSKNFTSDRRFLSTSNLDVTSTRMKSSSDKHALLTRNEAVSNNVHQFSSTTDYSQGHATPIVPLEVKRLITCHNTGETVLHKAARLGYPDIVLWCCQSRYIDIDATDNAGYTPLHESCIGSEVCIARYLLHYGASINIASGVDGRRPIHEAVDSDSLEMVRLLLSAGADIHLTTYSGKTVQEMAKSPEMKDFIKAYLDDLNEVKDGDNEVVWDLAPIWNGDSDECGMDLFSDLPTCDPRSEEFYVECSNRPL